VLDSAGQPAAVIELTEVRVVPISEVDDNVSRVPRRLRSLLHVRRDQSNQPPGKIVHNLPCTRHSKKAPPVSGRGL
jgi:hypothetical protein